MTIGWEGGGGVGEETCGDGRGTLLKVKWERGGEMSSVKGEDMGGREECEVI